MSERVAEAQSVKLSDRQRRVLDILSEDMGATYSHITTWTGLDLSQARRATRALARKGLAEHSVCFHEDEGTVCGSGYFLTPAGRAAISQERG